MFRSSSSSLSSVGHRPLLVALLTVTLLTAMDQTIVATALPAIVDDLGGGALMGWVFAGYTLAITVSMPVLGPLGDRYGRRRLFLGSVAGFVAASALCGMVTSMEQLLAARAVQGIAGGGVLVLSQAVVADAVPARDRSRFLAPIGAVFATSSVVAPLLGGVLTDTVGWRWIFWVNLPLGAVAWFLAARSVPRARPASTAGSFDVSGAVLLAVWMVGIVLLTDGVAGAAGGLRLVVLAGVTVLALVAFVRRMARTPRPLIPVTVYRNRVVVLCCGLAYIVGFTVFGLIGFVPTIMEGAYDLPPVQAGMTLLGLVMGIMATTVATGRLVARSGHYRRLPLIGCGTAAVGMAGMAVLRPEWGPVAAVAAIVLIGAGIGCFMQLTTVVVQDSAPADLVGTATAAVSLARELGVTMGAAGIGAALASRIAAPTTPDSYLAALTPVFWSLVAVFVAGMIVALLLPERGLGHGTPSVRQGS